METPTSAPSGTTEMSAAASLLPKRSTAAAGSPAAASSVAKSRWNCASLS